MNKLFYGDCLEIMRQGYLSKNTVDLIYLDPPFNSKRNYNLMYREMTGLPVSEQVEAFCDTWELDAEKEQAAREMPVLMREKGVDEYYIDFWRYWVKALRDTQPKTLAYMIYMVERLVWMRHILKPTGSIFLHCDPTVSHYIKVMMDGIFGHSNFRNEIIWKRTAAKGLMTRRLPSNHDVIFAYSNGPDGVWNADQVFEPYDLDDLDEKTEEKYSARDANGRRYQLTSLINPNKDRPNLEYEFLGVNRVWRWTRERMQREYDAGRVVQPSPGAVPRFKRYLDEQRGKPIGDVWVDIAPINARATERLGYPTQKPLPLLDRIIQLASNKGAVVFDPFCGCGTTIYSAHKNERQWIGCDIAILAIRLIKNVLGQRYGQVEGVNYEVDGIPVGVEQAEELFKRSPSQFQHWFVETIGGFPSTRKSADKGIDGRMYIETSNGLRDVVIQVKGGKLRPTDVRDLVGVLAHEESAELAVFLSLQEPTKAMREAGAKAGTYEYRGVHYDRVQFLTVRDVLIDKKTVHSPTAVKIKGDTGQDNLGLAGATPGQRKRMSADAEGLGPSPAEV